MELVMCQERKCKFQARVQKQVHKIDKTQVAQFKEI